MEDGGDDPAHVARALEVVARALDTTALAHKASLLREAQKPAVIRSAGGRLVPS